MEIAFVWIAWSIVVSIIANSRGRSWLGWLLLSFFITPILMNILVMCLPRIGNTSNGNQIQTSSVPQDKADVRVKDHKRSAMDMSKLGKKQKQRTANDGIGGVDGLRLPGRNRGRMGKR